MVPFHIINLFDEVDDKLYTFERLYLDILDEHAPFKQIHIRVKQVLYMTEEWRKQGGQKTPIAPGTFFVSESSNKK